MGEEERGEEKDRAKDGRKREEKDRARDGRRREGGREGGRREGKRKRRRGEGEGFINNIHYRLFQEVDTAFECTDSLSLCLV